MEAENLAIASQNVVARRHRDRTVLETIGATPVVRLQRMGPSDVAIYLKLESFNPMGSVKDRMALGMIEAAERSGQLLPGQTVVEATSGNTGIALAMVCAARGYPLVLVMAESFSLERRRILRYLGARVVLTPAAEKGSGMVAKARELAATHGWYLCSQFDNEANADAHSRTTAREILNDFGDRPLDYFVTGYGTGGTLKGVARVLRGESPSTRIVAVEPDNCALLGSKIEQPRRPDGRPSASHPAFRPHPIQGWAPDFVPPMTEHAVAQQWIDQLVAVSGDDALVHARRLAREEGIFAGISAGATLAAAIETAQTAPRGSTILCMIPDTGERYLSTPLFDDISDDMNAAEWEISRSTPSARFDAPATAPTAPVPVPVPATQEALDWLHDTLAQATEPVVVFALRWCEFTWSAFKLLDAMSVAYQTINLDTDAFRDNAWAGAVRAALHQETGAPTLPQIFIGGTLVGGATDLLDEYRRGRLQSRLRLAGATFTDDDFDVESFLPAWVHKG